MKRSSIQSSLVQSHQTSASYKPYAVFQQSPSYSWFTLGNLFYNLGQQMLSVAVGWQVFEQTHSLLNLGFIGLALWLPVVLFTIPSGYLADHYSRKKIVLVSQLILMFCSLGLLFMTSYPFYFIPRMPWIASKNNPSSTFPINWFYLILFLNGSAQAFNDTSKQSLFPELVTPQLLNSAITWNSSIFQLSSVIGPALGGFLITIFGCTGVYWITSCCSLIFIICLFCVRHNHTPTISPVFQFQNLWSGIRFIKKEKIILATITLDLFAVLFGGAIALLPAFAQKVLHCGAIGLGWLRAAPAIGACLMSIILTHLPPLKKAGPLLIFSVIGFGIATIIFGFSHFFILSFLMLLFTGILDNISVVIRATLIQILTPNTMRGRVTSISYIFIHSSNDLGGFESGLAAFLFGLQFSVVLGGIGCVLAVLVAAWIWPEIWKLNSLHQAHLKESPPPTFAKI